MDEPTKEHNKDKNDEEDKDNEDDKDDEDAENEKDEDSKEEKRNDLRLRMALRGLKKCVNATKSDNLDMKIWGVRGIRQLLCSYEEIPVKEVVDTEVVPFLVSILFIKVENKDKSSKTPEEIKIHKLQFEAAWSLTNIAGGESQYTLKLVQLGCVEGFVQLLKSDVDIEIVDHVIWGLGNIAGDSAELRDKVLH
ncbi:hypothetical protein RFI_09047, partial [Reticulomyxa filosa]